MSEIYVKEAAFDSAPILEAKDLVRTYRAKDRVIKAIDHVSVSLMPGRILGIVGESGSGKSTLIRHIACLEQPDAGRLFFRGEEYTGKTAAYAGRHMQMIFQDSQSSFDPKMRFDKSLREARKGQNDPELLKRLLEEVRLDESFLSRFPRSLSGGQCQRMSIVRAVYSGAEVLLCDEATSALDVASQALVIELLQELKETHGISMIFVSHDLGVVSQLCDEIMVMKNGRCVERGSSADVINRPKDEYTRQLLDAVMEVGTETGLHGIKDEPAILHEVTEKDLS